MVKWCLAIVCISFSISMAKLILDSPQNGHKVVLDNAEATAALEVAYTMDFATHEHQDKSRVEACIEMLGTTSSGHHKTVPVPLRCYPFVKGDDPGQPITKRIVVDGLIVHNYKVSLFLREKGEENSTLTLAGARNFRVLLPGDDIELPAIDMVNETQVALGYGASLGTIFMPYSVAGLTGEEPYELCVHIKLAPTGTPEEAALIQRQAYPRVNLPADGTKMCLGLERGLVLQRIQPCSVLYKLTLWLHDKLNGIDGPASDSFLRVNRLEHSLPKVAIQPDKRVLEWSLPSNGTDKEGKPAVTGGDIDYLVQGPPTALAQTETCLELLLLQGGTADFDLYRVYGGQEGLDLDSTALEAAVDEGIADKVKEEQEAERVAHERALQAGADLRFDLDSKWDSDYRQQFPRLYTKCQASPLDRVSSLSLHGVPSGLYVAKIYVAHNYTAHSAGAGAGAGAGVVDVEGNTETEFAAKEYYHFRDTTTRVVVAVQRKREFVPTYVWQGLRGWHTVPFGLETKLPMESLGYEPPSEDDIEVMGMGHDGGDMLSVEEGADNVQSLIMQRAALQAGKPVERYKKPAFYARPASRKIARIPDPWQIQLPMPEPSCRFFLRINVYRDMSTGDILDAAAEQCRDLPPSCISMVDIALDGTTSVIDRNLNVEAADLFNRQLKLALNKEDPKCVRSRE